MDITSRSAAVFAIGLALSLISASVYAQTSGSGMIYDATGRSLKGYTVVTYTTLLRAADGGLNGTIQVKFLNGAYAYEIYELPMQGTYRVQRDGGITIRAKSDRGGELSLALTIKGSYCTGDTSGENFEVNTDRSSLNIHGVGRYKFLNNPICDAYVNLP